MTRLWDKGEPLDERILRYTAGEDHRLDERLVAYDVKASIAHATMLHQQRLLSAGDLAAIQGGLEELAREHAAGTWQISLDEEDCHTALERRLTERIGEAGGRVHLGRSRNDQVLAALRLYLLEAATGLADNAVQLSRGKAEAGLVFELCLLVQDLGRLAADLLLFYTQEFRFVALPDSMTTGSSIMPQKRNPDVLELVRAAGPTLQAALVEILGIPAKLGAGYQRDLQRLKAPLFRAIDLAADSCQVMTALVAELRFLPANIHLDDSIYAAGRANRIVLEEGVSFREAYQRVAAELARKPRP